MTPRVKTFHDVNNWYRLGKTNTIRNASNAGLQTMNSLKDELL